MIPDGTIDDSTTRSRSTYLQVKEQALAIEKLYKDAGVHLRRDSSLGLLIKAARDLWEGWFMDKTDSLTPQILFAAMHIHRISEALLPLRHETKRDPYLRALLSGTFDFFERTHSRAKDIFWELEVWSKLREKTIQVALQDPPDLVMHFTSTRVAIACKKVYSEKHIQNVLSKAVAQVERESEFGVAAINIDDLLPANATLRQGSFQAVREQLDRYNMAFLEKHERHFRKYLSGGRLLLAIISSSVIADVAGDRPRFNNTCEWTAWTIPHLPERHRVLLDRLQQLIAG